MLDTRNIFGIPIPFDSRVLLGVLGVHVVAGLGAVISGAVAMLSPKRHGRHPTSGLLYYRCLLVVTVTMAVLSAVRWREDYHLFALGLLSISAGAYGLARVRRRPRDLRVHLMAFGSSYILLLTAFYVDNGRNLPLWNRLPSIAYWLLPSAIGVPLIFRALRVHPLLRSERVNTPHHRGGA